VSLGQLLDFDVADFGRGGGQAHPMSVQRRGFEAVLGREPVLACFGKSDLGRTHVGALGDVAAHSIQCCPCWFLRGVPLAQLLAPPVDDAHVDGELITDNPAAAVALGKFDAFDLRRQLATLNHREMRCGITTAKS
jgi:hypothetical protein